MKYKEQTKDQVIRFRVDMPTSQNIERVCSYLEWTKSRLARECMRNYLNRTLELLPEFRPEFEDH